MDLDSVFLQPLHIPEGCRVTYQTFGEIDPTPEMTWRERLWFTEDLLQVRHDQRNRLLDLGWYPDMDVVSGRFCLVVYEGDFHGRLLHEFTSRDRLAVVAEIERLLVEIAAGKL